MVIAATAGPDAGQIRRAVARAVRVHGFVEYAAAYDLMRRPMAEGRSP